MSKRKYRIYNKMSGGVMENVVWGMDGKVYAPGLMGVGCLQINQGHLSIDLSLGVKDMGGRELYEGDWVSCMDENERVFHTYELVLDMDRGVCLSEEGGLVPLRQVAWRMKYIGSHKDGKKEAKKMQEEIAKNWKLL